MRYRFYTTSEKAWGAMLAAIMRAERSIYLEMYIFESDTVGYDFLAELEHKAQSGIRVVVILDSVGSFGLAESAIERLRGAGAEVLFFSYWWRRTHRKLLIVDESIVFMGGVNISGKFAPWRDLQVRLHGVHVARVALTSFAHTYKDCGGENLIVGTRDKLPLLRRTRLWFVEHVGGKKRHALREYYKTHIDDAKTSIVLVTPYFIPHRWLIAHIHHALMRGVKVAIIVPEHTDHAFIDRINAHYLAIFTKLGAVCLLSPAMNHAKAMLIDEKEGTIGSHNIDALSFDWNAESTIFFDDPKMVQDLSAIIASWKADAKIFHTETYPARWYDKLTSTFLHFFQSVL